VFVYGTLKPGEENFDRYCAGRIVSAQEAIALGQLYDLPFGYPAMTPGSGLVYGVVLSFTDPTLLVHLDELEAFDPHRPPEENEYIRQKIETFSLNCQPLGWAWVYLMNSEQAKQLGGMLLPDGWWTGKAA
jgi:gamma-glutamylcyclotransferase (GGCT)/AIG2-like uncharacterized protein YtfP